MSKARAKGTDFENHVLEKYLKEVFPDVERAPLKGINDYGDFVNVGNWLIEARNRKTWALPAWIRGIYRKLERVDGNRTWRWMLIFKADKRGDLSDDYVLMSATQAFHLIRETHEHSISRH